MKKRPDSTSIFDIVRAARLAQTFVEGMSKEQFLKDLKTQAAICRQLELIGEAATRLSTSFRDANPSIPWKQMIGMRNILIHLYEEVCFQSSMTESLATNFLPKECSKISIK